MNVPKLRFPEFHDDYEIKELSEITNGISSGGLSKPLENGKYKVYGSVGIIGSSKYYDYDGEKILVARVGANAGIVNKINEKCCISDNTLVLEPKNILNNYLYYSLIYFNPRKLIFGSGQPLVTGSQLKKVKIGIPHYTEQQKVADFFSLLDKKIEFQAQKIEALKLFKSGIKNKIMNVNCDPILLGDIIKKWNLKNKKNIINYIESISNKYGFISQKEQFDERKITSTDLSNYYIIKKNVFAYNPSRLDVGSLALKKDNHVSIISPLYVCFTTKENNEYLFEWFNSKYFKKEIYSKFEGGVRNTLNFNSLSSVKINIPNLNEQNKIVNILREFNEKINVESVKLDKLNELKKGLMQNMFV